MNYELAHKIQMFTQAVRASRTQTYTKLMLAGWQQDVVERGLDEALAWANTHCLVEKQKKELEARARRKTKLKGDDALDLMFTSVGADPNEIPRKAGRGNAAGLMAAQSQGNGNMALGLNYSSGGGGDIIPFVKYDARAGRFFRRDRSEQGGQYVNNDVDITASFKAVIDMENIEVGFMKFGNGAAPEMLLVKLGEPMPQKPADIGFKQGARMMLKLHADCGGDVRECSSSAAAFLKGIDDLHTEYEAKKVANGGKLPVVVLKTTMPITSGSGQKKSTNYQPVFEIIGWAPRPTDLVHTPKSTTRTELPPNNFGTPPATGSTQVAPPAPAQPRQPETADMGFG